MGFLSDLHLQIFQLDRNLELFWALNHFMFLLLEKEIKVNPSELIESPKIGKNYLNSSL